MFEKNEYRGIDYGLGQTNNDPKTGIRFGVISVNSLESLMDALEPVYLRGCPECGEELAIAEDGSQGDDITPVLFWRCDGCAQVFPFREDDDFLPDEPAYFEYEEGGYKISSEDGGEAVILKSPYFTHAQFCSPCFPGAGNLNNPCDSGPETYCLGHDWFEDERAPYPVFSVETGREIVAQ